MIVCSGHFHTEKGNIALRLILQSIAKSLIIIIIKIKVANLVWCPLLFYQHAKNDQNEFIRWSAKGVHFILTVMYHSNEWFIVFWLSIHPVALTKTDPELSFRLLVWWELLLHHFR